MGSTIFSFESVADSPAGSRVTASRLYPELNQLLEARISSIETSIPDKSQIPKHLIEALRKHVFNNMPLRLLLLPEMKLLERDDVVKNIVAEMDPIVDRELFSSMTKKIVELGQKNYTVDSYDQQEDAREDPWKAVCQFLFQKFARYAILSHTWLPTGEVTYQDTLKEGWSSLEGPGFDKLKGFCEATHQDHGITLAWIDTLCINKDSSAELDESIRSMYKWYQNSSICITYLRDTVSLEDMKTDTWFKRGWTLQELIAPKSLQFYSHNWTRLTSDVANNDKASPNIQEIIHNVTGIKAKELIAFDPLNGSDVPTRMRWAASRTTTRGEDQAYSLMGIFGVNFSICYGEGAERAFFRLIEAIISSRHTSHVIQVLHWAGKAVSDNIHTSQLIPSKPECYNIKNKVNTTWTESTFFPTLAEPMVLTHLGLRVRLLISSIPVHAIQIRALVPTVGPNNGPFNIRLRILDNNHIEPLQVVLEKRLPEIPTVFELLQTYSNPMAARLNNGERRLMPGFFCGVYTFDEDYHANCVYLPFTAYAFFLCIPNMRPGLTSPIAKDFGPTSKIGTREVVQIKDGRYFKIPQQSDRKQGFITIDKQFLEGAGMGIVDAYL